MYHHIACIGFTLAAPYMWQCTFVLLLAQVALCESSETIDQAFGDLSSLRLLTAPFVFYNIPIL